MLIFSAIACTIRKRVEQLRTGKLDIYEVTGELGFNLVVVPGATSLHTAKAITSLILTIDKITLPAIVETYEMDRFNAFLETGLDKMHATVRYIPSISVNIFVRDDSGNQF